MRSVAAFMNRCANDFGHEAFDRQAHTGMLTGEGRERTTDAANDVFPVPFDMSEGTEMLVQHLARKGHACVQRSRRPSSARQTPFLHDAAEVGTEPVYATRSATGKYRTSPLRGIWQHPPYFHDGSAGTLSAVVDHYDQHFTLNLSASQKADLVEFLKSL